VNNHTKYTKEFKIEAVKLITEHGYSINKAAKHLGLGSTTLANWVKRLKGDDSDLSSEDLTELKRLRKENRELKMERDILKEAAVYFAGESKKSTRL